MGEHLKGNVLFHKHAMDTEQLEKCGTALVIIGEKPYAEQNGDRRGFGEMAEEFKDDFEMVLRVKGFNGTMKVVLILLTGRPLPIADIVQEVDALLVAWLPGTEGGGVADVLCGVHAPTGRLSIAWPNDLDGGDTDLYPRGSGIVGWSTSVA